MKELAYIFIFIGCVLFFMSLICLKELNKIINDKFNSIPKTIPDNQKLKSEFSSLKSEFSSLKSELIFNSKNQEINQTIQILKNELIILKKQVSNFTIISSSQDYENRKYSNKIEELNSSKLSGVKFLKDQFDGENIKNKDPKVNLKTIVEYINNKEINNINNYAEVFCDSIIQDERKGYYLIQIKEHEKYNYYLLCKVGRDYENYQKIFQKKNYGKENVIIKIINPAIIDLTQEEYIKMKHENKIDMEMIYNTKHQQGLVEVE